MVMLLIGIMAGIVGYNMIGWVARGRITATWASMKTIKHALDAFSGFNGGAYPANLEALKTGTNSLLPADTSLLDGWKNPFIYATPGTNGHAYDLFSKGPNGTFEAGAGDDLDIWKEPKEQ